MPSRIIERQSYAKLPVVMEIPDLLHVQRDSYIDFLQPDASPNGRKSDGLQGVFETIFPITDVHNIYSLEFVSYAIGRPKYGEDECRERGTTFAAPLRATLRLVSKEKADKSGEAKIKDVVEQQVYLGDLPIMTQTGTFVINGSERVIVSQLHRSPGVFFDESIHPNGKRIFTARIIPYRGAWVEFSMDINDVMYVHIDRKRKLPVTVLLRAFGYGDDLDLLNLFYEKRKRRLTGKVADKLLATDIVDGDSGEVIAETGASLTPELIESLSEQGITDVEIFVSSLNDDARVIENTLRKDSSENDTDALYRIYALLRPGDPPNVETARGFFDKLFFSPQRYDLGDVGRYRMTQKLEVPVEADVHVLTQNDFLAIVKYLIGLRNDQTGFQTDDIDHLGNRRTRTVGELLSQQFSIGLSRMRRTIRERMSLRDTSALTPQELVNAKTVATVIASFFGSSQLSQFMQQTNPLDELTHKRRLSALGPGGLTRERAGFEVRDVHHTHYGRVCPIETPEGPNIGLIMSLSTYARVNPFGFIETPYRVVTDGTVSNDIRYLSSDEEDRYVIAQANTPLNKDNKFERNLVKARRRGDFPMVHPADVQYMDVSPVQLVSVAAALIPFLEHDDANRALMGSNMQRQAVPLLITDAPYVGTGMERRVAVDSGAVITAEGSGEVASVDANSIVICEDEPVSRDPLDLDPTRDRTYRLIKFRRSNQDCCINQRPLVEVGARVEAGQIIADGPATDRGDLALGRNALVAFMPWRGYNFEDAIVVSERVLKDDIFTSIHIEEFELQVRDTKRGQEELTREIPNVSESTARNLDDHGIVRVGASVIPGDILVGKVTPKGETELSPEERLLRAIFGEKAGDVRDASLKAPPGMDGVVIDTRVFSRKERDEQTKKANKDRLAELRDETDQQMSKVRKALNAKAAGWIEGMRAGSAWRMEEGGEVVVQEGQVLVPDLLDETDIFDLQPDGDFLDDKERDAVMSQGVRYAKELTTGLEEQHAREEEKIVRGDELASGVIQLVKIHIARKRKLQVGDKMAGRHGNKGVVARIVPEEDMPYLPDGTPVEIILNPLGVPSRMNLGQVLETHLGWAAEKLGVHMAAPVFDGASIDEIKIALREAGLPESGQATLSDGMTGEQFYRDVTVGRIYMLKLAHLVADKIHARSIGPYSLVTQQPLGGKAQFGGQRFGEMEVWALEAYGASYLLQEMLTVKSDDVAGRAKIYEAIVKGENPSEPGVPESFNVLVKELQSLCLDVVLQRDGQQNDE